MRTFVCDEDGTHEVTLDEAVAEPQPCLEEGCSGQLWLNRSCVQWVGWSYYAPPEPCERPVAPGARYCERHLEVES